MTQQPNILPGACLIRVRSELEGRFTAEAVGLPEVRATADSRDAAVEKVRDLLSEWLAAGELAVVTPNARSVPPQPLRRFAGHSKDDPDFDRYLEEIQRYRAQADQQQCPDSSSTPTT